MIRTNVSSNTKYYFSDSYKTNDNTKKITLSGNIIQSTLDELWKDKSSNYKYTCFSTTQTGTCTTLAEIQNHINSVSAQVKYHSYLSRSYESTYTNEYNSTIKTKVDFWYKANIEDKGYSKYLSDNIFCNDRSIISGDGFTLNQTTVYSTFDRLINNKSPILKCSRQADQFTISLSNNLGNGELTYPVGLLTIDEAVYAGGKYNSNNSLYYLYTGESYFTMSPSEFYTSYATAFIWSVYSTGTLVQWRWVSDIDNIRPVINLNSDILITSGNGTVSSPYQLS